MLLRSAKRERSQVSSGAKSRELMAYCCVVYSTRGCRRAATRGKLPSRPSPAILSAAGISLPQSAFTGRNPLKENCDEDSSCSPVWRAHARERFRVCLPLPRRHEEDRRGDGEEPEAVGAADGRRQEIPGRRGSPAQGRQAPGVGRHAGEGDEDPRDLTDTFAAEKTPRVARRFFFAPSRRRSACA